MATYKGLFYVYNETENDFDILKPDIDADNVIGGVFHLDRIPELTLDKIPTLDSSKIPDLNASKITDGILDPALFPAIAISSVHTVTSMASLSVIYTGSELQSGDVVISINENKSYIHNGGTAGDASDFTELKTPTSGVTSVNSMTGAVTLTKAHIGLNNVDNTADASKNVLSASKWTNSRKLTLGGDATGEVTFNGENDFTLTVTVANNSHEHTISNITNLGDTLLAKQDKIDVITQATFSSLSTSGLNDGKIVFVH